MTNSLTIQQCPHCLRYFAGGEVVGLSLGDGFAAVREGRLASVPCGRSDCGDCVTANVERERARRQHSVNHRRERQEARQICKSEQRDVAAQRGERPAVGRLPYPDADLPEAEAPMMAVAQPLTQSVGAAIEHSLSQNEFVASGKADTANLKLREFLDHVITTGQVGVFFSRKLLKGFCGNDYINNRIDDLRPYYAERGIKIMNGEYSPNESTPKSSHYRLLLMSDAECQEFQRTGKPPVK